MSQQYSGAIACQPDDGAIDDEEEEEEAIVTVQQLSSIKKNQKQRNVQGSPVVSTYPQESSYQKLIDSAVTEI